jgi:hypothetical protein
MLTVEKWIISEVSLEEIRPTTGFWRTIQSTEQRANNARECVLPNNRRPDLLSIDELFQ